jgi:hypothetical protein
MKVQEMPSSCALKLTHDVYCLGRTDAFSKQEAAKFDTMAIEGPHYGEYVKAGIVIISPEARMYGPAVFKRQREFLKKKGYKLLGTFPGSKGRSRCELWGSKEFKFPRQK